jgi:acyl-CoA thioesterase-1
MSRFWIFLIAVFYFSAASAQPTQPARPTPSTKIVIVGDSLTEGYGVSHEAAYPALVQEKARKAGRNWQITNAGISGSTSASATSRVKWQLKQKPDAIVLALGANDGLRGVPVAITKNNLESAITAINEAHVKCLLVGMKMPPNYGAKYTRDFERIFTELAKKHKIPLLPFLLVNVAGRPDLNQPDGIHPTEKGHAILAETVYKFLAENL